ncbi:family 2 encapsulin nanocompartment cargo protein terpene cyclase [Nocardia aurea]|uniref:family 2 encapsulin nanocompartment cargo protein terpene cyclase n=1 Tax=Nocardia aurea TaxID=2144174 RepID=UPI000D6993AE|nr:family 2 encapsulin nanocompartment cargo protein terpene cyclase [Nocardia aurea]
MSVISRATAPPVTNDLASIVAALLSLADTAAPTDPFGDARPISAVAEAVSKTIEGGPVPSRASGLLGPAGPGTAALRLPASATPSPMIAPRHTATHRSPASSAAAPPRRPETAAARSDSPSIGHSDDHPAIPIPRTFPRVPVGSAQGVDPTGFHPPSVLPPPGGPVTPATVVRVPRASEPIGHGQRVAPTAAGDIPPLYCPPPTRDDPVLAELVNDGLLAWVREIGLYEGRTAELREADFGRLIMLAHPDCDDPDRLLAAAKCAVSEWSVDDYYCEEGAEGSAAELGPRLELVAAAMDPVHLPVRYIAESEAAMRADPVLRAFRTSFDHLGRYASPAQLARLRTEIAGWFIALGAEAGWRVTGRMPPVWEYLANRQPHSFLPCMALCDVVGGYELGAAEYTDPVVRRVVTTAALAGQLVNDLYSMAREDRSEHREFNLPTVLAAEENCSRREAVLRTAAAHDELMHRFESEATPLAATGSPELHRFLAGLWAWMGGSRAWHTGSKRYQDVK